MNGGLRRRVDAFDGLHLLVILGMVYLLLSGCGATADCTDTYRCVTGSPCGPCAHQVPTLGLGLATMTLLLTLAARADRRAAKRRAATMLVLALCAGGAALLIIYHY